MKRCYAVLSTTLVLLLLAVAVMPAAYSYSSEIVATANIKVTINDNQNDVIVVNPDPNDTSPPNYTVVEDTDVSGNNEYVIVSNDVNKSSVISGKFDIAVTMPTDKSFMVKITLVYTGSGNYDKPTSVTITIENVTYKYSLPGVGKTAADNRDPVSYYLGCKALDNPTDEATHAYSKNFDSSQCFKGNSSAMLVGRPDHGTSYNQTVAVVLN